MSRRAQIVVLCEDKLTDCIACRFLKKRWGIDRRNVRVPPYPADGRGSGAKFALDNYVKEVEAFRTQAARTRTILVVVIDADENTVKQRQQQLDQACRDADLPVRTNDESILHFIPKWHIETWLAYLDGVDVDENEKEEYKKDYYFKNHESDSHHLTDQLAEICRHGETFPRTPPPSLVAACEEFDRIRDAFS